MLEDIKFIWARKTVLEISTSNGKKSQKKHDLAGRKAQKFVKLVLQMQIESSLSRIFIFALSITNHDCVKKKAKEDGITL